MDQIIARVVDAVLLAIVELLGGAAFAVLGALAG